VWPDADVDRLHRAARTWRAAAAGLDDAGSYCGLAAEALSVQRSPEIPLALAAASDLRATIRALAASCDGLARDCEAYADVVEARHAELRALLHEILQLVVEGVVIGAALSAITAGAGAAVALGSIAARVAAQSPRFAAVVAALRVTASSIASSVRSTHAAVRLHRARLERFLRVPARNERGALALGRPWWSPGWLAKHEHSGSHTLREHVGRTAEELHERAIRLKLSRASSFRNEDEAERIVERTIQANSRDIQKWLRSDEPRLPIADDFRAATGITVRRSGEALSVHGVRVVLEKDPSMPLGFRVLTSYPQPAGGL